MKQPAIALLLIGTITTQLHAQGPLSDRWKETRRQDLKKKEVSFSDTLRLSEVGKESMLLRKGAFQYKGAINNDVLDLGYTNLHIIKNNKEEIQLGDEDYIHIFTRESKDMSAADAAVKKAGIDLPSAPVEKIDHELLKGTWEAYKRSGRNGPLEKIDYATLIKTLSFELQKPEDYYGTITAGASADTPLYSIKDTKGSDLITDGRDKKEHRIKVWRLTADELVIEDESGILYYMKHFR